MKVKYVTAVLNLEISTDLGRGDRLDDTTYITNHQATIRGLVEGDFAPIIGGLEWQHIRDARAVIYSVDDLPASTTPADFLKHKLFKTSAFFHALWLFFDNTVDNELGFLFYRMGAVPVVSSNYMAIAVSTASGEETVTRIDREQLREIRKLYRELLVWDDPLTPSVTKLVKGEARFSRAFYYVQAARITRDIGMKLLHQCSALEHCSLPPKLSWLINSRSGCRSS